MVNVKPTSDAEVARSAVTRGKAGVYMSVANGGTALCRGQREDQRRGHCGRAGRSTGRHARREGNRRDYRREQSSTHRLDRLSSRSDRGRTAKYRRRVPVWQVLLFRTALDWATKGAVPDVLQTCDGSLTVGLDDQHLFRSRCRIGRPRC